MFLRLRTRSVSPVIATSVVAVLMFGLVGSGIIYRSQDAVDPSASASVEYPADINSDRKVNVADLSYLLSKWGTSDALADINHNGVVNVTDLSILLSKWGTTPPAAATGAGAQLPIQYDIATVTGTKLYVAPTGNDTTGTGTVDKPYKTIRKAVSAVSANNTTILVKGGTYDLTAESTNGQYAEWSKSGLAVAIKAMPGETPVLDGSQAAPLAIATEVGVGNQGATLKYFDYTTAGEGVGAGLKLSSLPKATFSGTSPTGLAASAGYRCVNTTSNTYSVATLTPTTGNPSGCASGTAYVITAYYADQAWYDGTRLTQVLDKNKVTVNTFYVERDTINNGAPQATKMYVDNSLDTTKLRVSSSRAQLRFSYANASVEGLRILNNSPGLEGAFVTMYAGSGADNIQLKNIELIDNANIGVVLAGGESNAISGATVDQITAQNTGWSGLTSMYSDNLRILNSHFARSNLDKEYEFAPQSGGIKFSRVYASKIIGNTFEANYGSGLWYDQSNYDAQVVGNRFIDNVSTQFFYEISHKLLFANNYVRASSASDTAVRSAGSGDLRFVNNTIVGGGAGIAIYTDDRSEKYDSDADGTPDRWCSENAYRYSGTFNTNCGGMTSDLNRLHKGQYGATNDTPGMDWVPTLTLLLNNIITDQSATTSAHSNCTYDAVAVCMTAYHDTGARTDPLVLVSSAAILNGNIYQTNNTAKRFFHLRLAAGQTCGVDATSLSALKTAFSNTACFDKSVEANGKFSGTHQYTSADGTPTTGLTHSEAVPIPTDAIINQYIPAGTTHYGVISN